MSTRPGTARALRAGHAPGLRTHGRLQRRQPTDTVLYRTVEAHLKTFRAHTAGDAERSGLPVFVKREFEAFLRRGILAHGFARVRCEGCAFERLVPFSCYPQLNTIWSFCPGGP